MPPLTPTNTSRRALLLVDALLFTSGAAALVYEISWTRQLGLLFGHTVQAASVVLASYFAGMALGYWLAGKWASRSTRPLVMYGVLEIVAALWAVAVPSLLALLENTSLVQLIHSEQAGLQTAARAAVGFLLLLPATVALGATLPMVAEWLSRGPAADRAHLPIVYGLNTLGALAGVLLATLLLLATVGVVRSSYVAAAIGVCCGLAALVFSKFVPRSAPADVENRDGAKFVEPTNSASAAGRRNTPHAGILLALVALSGFGTLALEVLYARMFALVFHNSTYTFGLVLAVFLAGLGAGSLVASRLGRMWPPLVAAIWIFVLGSMAIAASVLMFIARTELKYFRGGDSYFEYMLGSLGLVTLVVLPVSLLLGILLPLFWQAAAEEGRTLGRVVGSLTAANTLAATCGALAASFLLLPWLGLWGSFTAIAALYLLGGTLLFVSLSSKPWSVGFPLFVSALLLLFVNQVSRGWLGIPPESDAVARWESAYGWIDVVQNRETKALSLRENVQYAHGSSGSVAWEQRQAHVPLLIHPQPRDVLFLGLGTGATAGGAVPHGDIQSLAIVELIPDVIPAARHFDEFNNAVLVDPRTKIYLDDARHFLLASDRKFDVIVSDLYVPWESQTGYLYTVDHYRLIRQHLKPGGIFCQWFALWQLGPDELAMIADGFAEVFPNTTVWTGNTGSRKPILALIGSEGPLTIDEDAVALRLAALEAKSPHLDARLHSPTALREMFLGQWQPTKQHALNTDEHPRLEFGMPVTYADRDTLTGKRYLNFRDHVLDALPKTGASFTHGAHKDSTPASGER